MIQYETRGGGIPFRDWLLSLRDIEVRARIRSRLNRLALGNPGDCESVGSGIFELKFHFGPGYRVYFGYKGKQAVILLLGGDKSTQRKDIETAQDYWRDYQQGDS